MPVGTILEIKIDPNPSSLARQEKTLIDGQALLGREIRTRLRLARRQLVVQTIGQDFYLSAFLKMLTALSASAALSKAK